jgi:hypothetical protein
MGLIAPYAHGAQRNPEWRAQVEGNLNYVAAPSFAARPSR